MIPARTETWARLSGTAQCTKAATQVAASGATNSEPCEPSAKVMIVGPDLVQVVDNHDRHGVCDRKLQLRIVVYTIYCAAGLRISSQKVICRACL